MTIGALDLPQIPEARNEDVTVAVVRLAFPATILARIVTRTIGFQHFRQDEIRLEGIHRRDNRFVNATSLGEHFRSAVVSRRIRPVVRVGEEDETTQRTCKKSLFGPHGPLPVLIGLMQVCQLRDDGRKEYPRARIKLRREKVILYCRGIREDFYDLAVSAEFQKRLRVPLRKASPSARRRTPISVLVLVLVETISIQRSIRGRSHTT